MNYYGGCDAGSTYTKCVILDETGHIAAHVTTRSRINPVLSAQAALQEAVAQVPDLDRAEDLAYLVGTGYGRNKVPFADENISEISCHAMGVHVANPQIRAIIDIGGQDVKGIAVDRDGTVLDFAMNDKCAAGTGRFYETMAHAFEMSLEEFSNLSLSAKNVIPITAQCTVFAESEVISLIGSGASKEDIAFGIVESIVNKVASQCGKLTVPGGPCYLTGGLCESPYILESLSQKLGVEVRSSPLARYAGAIGAALAASKISSV